MKTIRLSLVTLPFLFAACTGGDPVPGAIKDFCACVKPAIDQSKELAASMKSGNMEEMQRLATDAQAKAGEMQGCMQKLQEKYKEHESSEDFRKRLKEGIDKECPMPKFELG